MEKLDILKVNLASSKLAILAVLVTNVLMAVLYYNTLYIVQSDFSKIRQEPVQEALDALDRLNSEVCYRNGLGEEIKALEGIGE